MLSLHTVDCEQKDSVEIYCILNENTCLSEQYMVKVLSKWNGIYRSGVVLNIP